MASGPYVFNCNSSRVAINNFENLKSSKEKHQQQKSYKLKLHNWSLRKLSLGSSNHAKEKKKRKSDSSQNMFFFIKYISLKITKTIQH